MDDDHEATADTPKPADADYQAMAPRPFPSHLCDLHFVSGEGVHHNAHNSLDHCHSTVSTAPSAMAVIVMSVTRPTLQHSYTYVTGCLFPVCLLPSYHPACGLHIS